MIQQQDFSRQNNIRLKGMPDLGADEKNLQQKILDCLKKVVPNTPLDHYDLERVHRVGPRNRDVPRHVFLRFANFKKKQEVMNALREKPENLKILQHNIQFFSDFSQLTMNFRRELKDVISILRSKNIHYHWGYPVFLKIVYKGKTKTVQEAWNILRDQGIVTKEEWESLMEKMSGEESSEGEREGLQVLELTELEERAELAGARPIQQRVGKASKKTK
ncbi:hypothetical protein JRQ81_012298 [Phrynocephalus forsythii]|uniref:Uncharacterized protein n=1 Tax=Phrynocephalus forsythii TaxID=171643 RepID=A0A9Q0X7L3_9SAUR|nr:hypothetical protein JRQ81_012298 [Phrynocephalus forsythii]